MSSNHKKSNATENGPQSIATQVPGEHITYAAREKNPYVVVSGEKL
jgi:hypothetical protein